MTSALPLYDNGTLKRGDKGDYIWKTEQALGVKTFEALFETPFAKRFPTFAKLLAVNLANAGTVVLLHHPLPLVGVSR